MEKRELDKEFKDNCLSIECPYGDGSAAGNIAAKIMEIIDKNDIDLKKKFYDL